MRTIGFALIGVGVTALLAVNACRSDSSGGGAPASTLGPNCTAYFDGCCVEAANGNQQVIDACDTTQQQYEDSIKQGTNPNTLEATCQQAIDAAKLAGFCDGASGGSGGVGGGTGGTGGGTGGTGGGTGGTGGGTGGTGGVMDATVQEVNDGTIGNRVIVRMSGVVATSQKFLVSGPGMSGNCLWGFFVSAPVAQAAPYTGVMVVSRNTGITEDGGVVCKPGGTDVIPDNVAAGDELTIVGETNFFGGINCTPAPTAEIQVDRVTEVTKTGTAAVPAPFVLSVADANKLANQDGEAMFHNQYGGVLVRIEGVSGQQDGTTGDIIGPFGVIKLNETSLEVHDKIYFYDLNGTGPRDPAKAPVFGFPTSFTSITGIAYLDFCTWSLNPRDKCSDMNPGSNDCP